MLLQTFLTLAKLDVIGQGWVANIANYNFQLYYKTGKANVEAVALSHIPWKERIVKNSCAIKAIMTGCSSNGALFEPYIGYGSVGPNLPVCVSD